MEKVEDILKNYIAENILFSDNGYTHAETDSFLDNGIIDSMNVLELVMFIEEKFEFTVEDTELVPDNFDSVKKLADFVRSKT